MAMVIKSMVMMVMVMKAFNIPDKDDGDDDNGGDEGEENGDGDNDGNGDINGDGEEDKSTADLTLT